jgi:hypothetical protein
MTPENRGHKSGSLLASSTRLRRRCSWSGFQSSETEIGKVAVADGNPGACHQQAIDSRHQVAKQRGGRREAERSGFGHLVPLLLYSGSLRCSLRSKLGIPDTTNNPFVCIAAFYLLHCSMIASGGGPNKRAAGNRRPQKCSERLLIRRRPCAADRARRNRGSPPPDGR